MGIEVILGKQRGQDFEEIARGTTNQDGRIGDLGPETLDGGAYQLVFNTKPYLGEQAFFPEVVIRFRISEGGEHYHVPLLLSPFGYSTYRGS